MNSLFEQHLGTQVRTAWAGDTWTADTASTRLNSWLDIRHKIAHGGQLPTNLTWIQGAGANPRLTLQLLRDCKSFFEGIAARTDAHVSADLLTRFALAAAPW